LSVVRILYAVFSCRLNSLFLFWAPALRTCERDSEEGTIKILFQKGLKPQKPSDRRFAPIGASFGCALEFEESEVPAGCTRRENLRELERRMFLSFQFLASGGVVGQAF
jgi:hypothetical protein